MYSQFNLNPAVAGGPSIGRTTAAEVSLAELDLEGDATNMPGWLLGRTIFLRQSFAEMKARLASIERILGEAE
jgi:hypothetical protein